MYQNIVSIYLVTLWRDLRLGTAGLNYQTVVQSCSTWISYNSKMLL